jgi:cell division protein FtsL
MSKIESFLKDNIIFVVTFVFSCGIIYSEFQSLRAVESRLNKKIKVISEMSSQINDLENRIIVLETTK